MAYTPTVTTYSARDCSVIINGQYITGLGEDMISIEKEEAFAENSVGAMGDVVRSRIHNDIYNVTLTVQVTSPQFDDLMKLCGKDAFFPVSIENSGLGIGFAGTKAGILEQPSISFGSAAEDVEFTICVYDGVFTVADRK